MTVVQIAEKEVALNQGCAEKKGPQPQPDSTDMDASRNLNSWSIKTTVERLTTWLGNMERSKTQPLTGRDGGHTAASRATRTGGDTPFQSIFLQYSLFSVLLT